MIYLGIDNGKDGAVVLLGFNGGIVWKKKTPILKASSKGGEKKGRDEYDITGMRDILREVVASAKEMSDSVFAFVEKAQAMPAKMGGGLANYSRGLSYGLWQGLLVGLGISYQVVSPMAWQKVMLAGVNTFDTKQAAAIAVRRLWPNENWKKTEKTTKVDEGYADAALIAEYGRRLMGGGGKGGEPGIEPGSPKMEV